MNRFCKHKARLALALCFSLLFGFAACETTTNLVSSTHFNQNAYDTDKELKDESLALIDKARGRTPHSSVAADVAALMQKIDSAIGVEKGRKGTLSPAFVDESKKQVGTLFDTMIATEGDKRARG